PIRWFNFGLAAMAMLMLAFSLWKTLDNRRTAADSLRVEIEEHLVRVRHVAALRERLTATAESTDLMAKELASNPPLIELLSDLTRRLPDGTWLEQLSISDGQLSIATFSNEAA